MPLALFTGIDFTNTSFSVKVTPDEGREFTIRREFNITDDAIDERVQSFVLVAEIGADVPDNFTCFQRQDGDRRCNNNTADTARFGATRIQINDNDGRFFCM